MIFSRFFSPSHSSNDPDTRLKAIENLSPDSPNERRILHELAFNDSVAAVSLAALEKLNSFALWLKMSQIAREPRLLTAAQAKVECALIDGDAEISMPEIKECLLKSAPAEQVIKCLPLMTELHQDKPFCLAIINKLGRSSFTQQLISATPETELKLAIIEQSQDSDLLQKLLRKATDTSVQQAIAERLAYLQEQAQKPVRLGREVTLVLSKLLALLEKSDYLQIGADETSLNQEFETLKADFACLDDETRDEYNTKLQSLNERVSALLARLKPEFEAQQQAAAHQAARQACSKAVAEVKQLHKQLQGEQILSLTLGEVTVFQQAVEAAEQALVTLQAFEAPADEIESTLDSYRHIWDRLPDLQRQVAALQTQLQTWQQWLADPNVTWQLEEIKNSWREQTASMALVPAFLRTQWQALLDQLKVREQQRQSSQQRHLKHCRKHLNIINNMVEQGKYRAAMARFQHLENDYQDLPADTQAMLEKRFEQTREQIARLEGWQIYLAAPRKPELIEQAEGLLRESQNDMPGRARSIKYLRQQWQSLGESNTVEDQALNRRFDELLEQAFEPCRRYYAELELQNDKAAAERQQLIEQMLALPASGDDNSQRFQQFETLKKQWQQAGQTDSERYRHLREAWDQACSAVTEVITPWLQQNRQAKQALIDKVNALSELDDIQQARAEAKALQAQWKTLGPAGKRFESKLWFAFKAANDNLFNKAKSVQAQQKAAQSQAAGQWREQLQTVMQALDTQSESVTAIQQMLDECQLTLKEVNDNKLQKTLAKELASVQAGLDKQLEQQLNEAFISATEQLVAQVLSDVQSVSTLSSEYPMLPSTWFKGKGVEAPQDWLKALLTLEVLAQLDSPEADGSLRSTVQLQLMQAKLNGEPLSSSNQLIGELLASQAVLSELDTLPFKQRLFEVCVYFGLAGDE